MKKIYKRPAMRIVELRQHTHLLGLSSESPQQQFVDDNEWEWDEGGGQ